MFSLFLYFVMDGLVDHVRDGVLPEGCAVAAATTLFHVGAATLLFLVLSLFFTCFHEPFGFVHLPHSRCGDVHLCGRMTGLHPAFQHVLVRLLSRCGSERCCHRLPVRRCLARARQEFFDGCRVHVFPRGPAKLLGFFICDTAGGPVVVYLEVCDFEVPLVMSPVFQVTRL